MKLNLIPALMLCTAPIIFAADSVQAVRGTVERVDTASESVDIKSPDGVVYSVTVVETTEVDGFKSSRPILGGIKKGTIVIAHGVATGSKVTAVELCRVGKGGLKATKATVKAVGEGGKYLVVTTAKGGAATYQITSKAMIEAAKGTAAGTKVVVYSTGKAGKKVAHFFEAA